MLLHRKRFDELNIDSLTFPYGSLKLELKILYAKCQHDFRMTSMMN